MLEHIEAILDHLGEVIRAGEVRRNKSEAMLDTIQWVLRMN